MPLQTAAESVTARRSMPQTGHSSGSDEDEERETCACECLRTLADQLCFLNAIERKHMRPPLDSIFSRASKILDHAASALNCQQCWIDSKVLTLIITTLQTVFNWAMQEQQSSLEKAQNIPVVVFGRWTVSEEESKMVKAILVDRVLSRSNSTTDVLRQRITHISRMANNQRVPYQVMDVVTLEFILQRLIFSVKEVMHFVKRERERDKETPRSSNIA
jgi:hypothetical protein